MALDLAKHFLTMLSGQKIPLNDHDIGSILLKVSGDEKAVLPIWVWWCGEAKRMWCEKEISGLQKGDKEMDLPLLARLARKLNHTDYQTWHTEWCRPILEKAYQSNKCEDLAQALYCLSWLDYRYIGVGRWDALDAKTHKWHHVTDIPAMQATMCHQLSDILTQEQKQLVLKSQDEPAAILEKLRSIYKVQETLSLSVMQGGIRQEAEKVFQTGIVIAPQQPPAQD
jgi:hypothetical protein